MLFTRIVSFFMAFMTLGLVAFANPVVAKAELEKRSGIPAPLTSLQTSVNTLLPQLKAAKSVGSASLIIAQLSGEITAVHAQITAEGALSKRDEIDINAVAALLAEIVQDVTETLDFLVGTLGSIVADLTFTLDSALDDLFKTLDLLIIGLLPIVAQLLSVVEGLLSEIVDVGLSLLSGLLAGVLSAV